MKRLRVFDLHTPWFWLTWLYYGRRYGKCTWEISYWPPSKHFRWSLYIWQWEPVPDERPQQATGFRGLRFNKESGKIEGPNGVSFTPEEANGPF
jgi:hypothetical protein